MTNNNQIVTNEMTEQELDEVSGGLVARLGKATGTARIIGSATITKYHVKATGSATIIASGSATVYR